MPRLFLILVVFLAGCGSAVNQQPTVQPAERTVDPYIESIKQKHLAVDAAGDMACVTVQGYKTGNVYPCPDGEFTYGIWKASRP